MTALSVMAFGVAGVLARYGLGVLFPRPASTFLINIAGCFAIGVVYAYAVERGALSPELRSGILVGFLGGFTTFSAYSLDTIRLLEAGRYAPALLYFGATPILGALATFAGLHLARR